MKEEIIAAKAEIELRQNQAKDQIEKLKSMMSAIEDRINEVQNESRTIDSKRKLDIADLKLKMQ